MAPADTALVVMVSALQWVEPVLVVLRRREFLFGERGEREGRAGE